MCTEGTPCYICTLMTPPVAPEAEPFALPWDQLGPGSSVCCAHYKPLPTYFLTVTSFFSHTCSSAPFFLICPTTVSSHTFICYKNQSHTVETHTHFVKSTDTIYHHMCTHMNIACVTFSRSLCVTMVRWRMSRIGPQSFGSVWILLSLVARQSHTKTTLQNV